MPGLAGLVSGSRPLRDRDEALRTLTQVGLIDGVSYTYRQYHADRVVILNTLSGLLKSNLAQPASDPAKNVFVFLEGEIYNLDELERYAGSICSLSPCAILLALFLERGEEFITLVNGEFNIVIFQKAEDRLLVFCDHIASTPMYYLEKDDCFYFGSEKKYILSLLEKAPSIDAVGLLQVFAHRFNLDERTFLSDIKRMIPGTKLVYQHGRLRVTRYQLMAFSHAERNRRIDDLIHEWGERLQQATSARLRSKERVQISLSAGLDSRAIACAVPRNFRPISSRTRGAADSLEATLAAEIAERLGFEHYPEDPVATRHSGLIPKIAWRTECETHYTNALSISNHAAIKMRSDFIAGGWLGDVSSGAHISADMLFPKGRQKFIDRAFSRHLSYSMASLRRVFRPEFLDRIFPEVREAFFASFAYLEGAGNIQVFEVWDLYQRQRRQTTSSMPVDSYLFEKIRPFYDKEYLDFTLTLPAHLRFGQSLYQSMIYRLGPEIRDVPSANNQRKLRRSILGNLGIKGATLVHRAATRGIRRIRPAYRNRIERRATDDIGQSIRQDAPFRRSIERFLGSADCDPSIFNQSGIRGMVDEHYEGVHDHSYLLGYVAMFSVGLPYFLNKTSSCPPEAEPL